MSRRVQCACGALLIVASLAEGSAAQDADLYRAPSSGISGNAATELSTIRRRDIGIGYSGTSLNRQTLNQSSVSSPFIGGYTGRTVAGGVNSDTYASAPRPAASFGVGRGPAAKPFSGASTRPTVSPYLNLFREDLEGFSDFNYQTLVRPQLQQMEINQDLQRRQQEINANVQALSAQPAFNPQGSQSQYPTGHTTSFRNLSHFYPLANQPRRTK
jgi:hypothetical protein